jgi:hypothetical protein
LPSNDLPTIEMSFESFHSRRRHHEPSKHQQNVVSGSASMFAPPRRNLRQTKSTSAFAKSAKPRRVAFVPARERHRWPKSIQTAPPRWFGAWTARAAPARTAPARWSAPGRLAPRWRGGRSLDGSRRDGSRRASAVVRSLDGSRRAGAVVRRLDGSRRASAVVGAWTARAAPARWSEPGRLAPRWRGGSEPGRLAPRWRGGSEPGRLAARRLAPRWRGGSEPGRLAPRQRGGRSLDGSRRASAVVGAWTARAALARWSEPGRLAPRRLALRQRGGSQPGRLAPRQRGGRRLDGSRRAGAVVGAWTARAALARWSEPGRLAPRWRGGSDAPDPSVTGSAATAGCDGSSPTQRAAAAPRPTQL